MFIPNLSPFGIEPNSFLTTIAIILVPHLFHKKVSPVSYFSGFCQDPFTMCSLFHLLVSIQLCWFLLTLILSTPGQFPWPFKKSDILFDQTPIHVDETPKTFQKIKHNNTKLALSFNTKLGIRSSLFILLCSHQNRER